MKKFFQYFREYWKENLHWPTILLVLLGLAVYIWFNYEFYHERYTFETHWVISKHRRENTLVLFLFLYYLVNYLGACFLVALATRKWDFFKKPMFWGISLFATFFIAFDTGFTFHYSWLRANVPNELVTWLRLIISNTVSIFTHLLPLWLFYKLIDQKTENFYGLTAKNVDWKLYWAMLGVMAILVGIASFHPSFYNFYPTYKLGKEAQHLGVDPLVTQLAYELAYGFDFITVEHMFRGFLVIGMAQVMGPRAIIPMAALYCTYHFGKPMGETISSIFGGYILGVVALYSRNVWGGVFVHMGIAWLMELAATLQNLFRS